MKHFGDIAKLSGYELPIVDVVTGNGIARPFWTWLLRRIAAQYERPATLGSLFDGQSSFPLSWQEVGGIPVWCSEIEKNAVAVSKYHFPDEG